MRTSRGLLLGGDPGEDRRAADGQGQCGIVERVDRRPGECRGAVQTEVVADLDRDGGVVAGDHLHRDHQVGQPVQRLGGVRLWRVQEDQQPFQVQALLVVRRRRPLVGHRAARDGDHAVAGGELAGQRLAGGFRHVQAARQDTLRRTLGHQTDLSVPGVRQHRDHPAVVVERDDPQPGPPGQVRPLPESRRGSPQRAVQRVAAGRGTVGRAVLGAQKAVAQHGGRVGRAGGHGAHEVDAAEGERAGLVGEQDVDVAEVLDAHQPLDQHLARAHPAGPGGQAGRHDRGQQLRRDPDGDGQREQQGVNDRSGEDHVDGEDGDGQGSGDVHQQHREAAQPDLELGVELVGVEAGGDLPELRARAGGDHDAATAARPDHGAHQGAPGQLGERCPRGDGRCRLLDRQRLTGQHGLLALHAVDGQQPQVGRHDVTQPQLHDVAGHQRRDVDLQGAAASHDQGAMADLGVQCFGRLLRAVLVGEPKPHGQRQDGEDHPGGAALTDED
jgi:hypothetical protein